MSHVLIVEDDDDYGQMLVDVLRWGGHEPLLARNVNTAIGSLRTRVPELILLNLTLPDGSGFDVLDALSHHGGSDVPVIVISGDPDPIERARSDVRVAKIHVKPCDLPTLMGQVAALLRGAPESESRADSPVQGGGSTSPSTRTCTP